MERLETLRGEGRSLSDTTSGVICDVTTIIFGLYLFHLVQLKKRMNTRRILYFSQTYQKMKYTTHNRWDLAIKKISSLLYYKIILSN